MFGPLTKEVSRKKQE